MGADMLIALAPVPFRSAPDGSNVPVDLSQVIGFIRRQRIDRIPDDVMLDALVETYLDFVDNEAIVDDGDLDEELDEEDERTLLCATREALHRFHTELYDEGRRDVAYAAFAGRPYYATGGMSWGDSPTDAFDLIGFTGRVGLWDAEISEEEIRDAEAQLSLRATGQSGS